MSKVKNKIDPITTRIIGSPAGIHHRAIRPLVNKVKGVNTARANSYGEIKATKATAENITAPIVNMTSIKGYRYLFLMTCEKIKHKQLSSDHPIIWAMVTKMRLAKSLYKK